VSAATAPRKLTASQARKLHDAYVAVKQLEAQLRVAKDTLGGLEDSYRERIPLSPEPLEAASGIRAIEAGGVTIRVTPFTTGERFSLKAYRELGHEVTEEMRAAITPGQPAEKWTIKAAKGPKKIGAVER
jgi:hypothetical protein